MAKSKKDRLKEAKGHLARAKDQWDRAATDSWEPADPAECVTKCFYSYENAVVAAATALCTSAGTDDGRFDRAIVLVVCSKFDETLLDASTGVVEVVTVLGPCAGADRAGSV